MSFSADKYLAATFDLGTYNCWDLTRDVWRDLTGRDLGSRTPENLSALSIRRKMDSDAKKFLKLKHKEDPCIVLMHRPRTMPHVGVFVKGRILHIERDGVRYQPLDIATLGFDRIGFYKCKA